VPSVFVLQLQVDHANIVRTELLGEHFLKAEQLFVELFEIREVVHFLFGHVSAPNMLIGELQLFDA
jgi:hypothetical protein